MMYPPLPVAGLAPGTAGECVSCDAYRRSIERAERNGDRSVAALYHRGLERHQDLIPHGTSLAVMKTATVQDG
ncbi:hypothetical protein CTZ27_03970 [Streptomyces griseocarneus]|nr:hypothetical protein CTZ27_03970 [Streptomyces griseocarneus]